MEDRLTQEAQETKELIERAFDRVMSEPTPETQTAAALELLHMSLGWKAHAAYMEEARRKGA
jgi:hypothetical protein